MYLFVVYSSIFLLFLINLIIDFSFATLLNILLGFVCVMLPSLFITIGIRFMPKQWFNFENKIYQVGSGERKLLNKLKVKSWKQYVPDLGQTVNFKKDKLQNPNDNEYLKKFLNETCYGEVVHELCIVSAMLSLIYVPHNIFWTIALPIAICFSLFNFPPILIQRYNRPRLIIQYKRNLQKSENLEKQENNLPENPLQEEQEEQETQGEQYDNNSSLRCAGWRK